jgi:hypothetical protein
MNSRWKIALLATATFVSAGCASSPEASDSWSRSYLVPLDEVYEQVQVVLEDEGYWVDAEAGKRRIEAQPSQGRGSRVNLTVSVTEVDGRSRVDVLTRAGAEPGVVARTGETQVLEFLHALDARMRDPHR